MTIITTEEVGSVIKDLVDPVTVKQMISILGVEETSNAIRDVANRFSYLKQQGKVARVASGTYIATDHVNGLSPEWKEKMEAIQKEEPTAADDLICQQCGFQAASRMGFLAHNTRSHKSKQTPDQLFERVGAACEVLFPDGIPMSRVIEVGELQKAILKVLSR